MKDSVSMGKTVYELDGNVVLIHHLDTGTYSEMEFKSPESARNYFEKYFSREIDIQGKLW